MGAADLARRFYSLGWAQGQLDVIDEICAPDVRDHHHSVEGREAVRAVVTQLRDTFPDLSVKVERQIVSDDEVVTHLRLRGTDRGGLFSMDPTGRAVDFSAIFIDRFVERRLVDHWGVSDMMSVFRQLEIIPRGWQADRPLTST